MKATKRNAFTIRPAIWWLAAVMGPVPVFAATSTALQVNVANMPLIVQTRGNIAIAPALLHSLSVKAGVPLRINKQIGTGTYLLRPTKPVTAQGIKTVATRLSSHPNVLGAHLYQQAAPAYLVAPAGHQVVLNGARLSGSSTTPSSYRWQQITGPKATSSGASSPSLTFLARQAAPTSPVVSDPTAINPGDLSSSPQVFDCAISAASVKKSLTAPALVSKQSFMCNPGSSSSTPGSGAPGAGTPSDNSGQPVSSTPTDNSGLPVSSTPTDNSGQPVGSTPTDNSGSPVTSTPTDNSGSPVGSTPADNSGFPVASTPSDNSGFPPGSSNAPGGGSGCNAVANNIGISNAVASGGGTANSTTFGISNAVANCGNGGSQGASSPGFGQGNGLAGLLGGLSVRKPMMKRNSVSGAGIMGFRLIATDQAGIAHVRNIYVRVYGTPAQAAPRAPLKAGSSKSPLKAGASSRGTTGNRNARP